MQQRNIALKSLSEPFGRVQNPSQRTIEIEQTPAYHRHKQTAIESPGQVKQNSSQTRTQDVLTTVIGDHQISPRDPLTDYQFDTDRLSTGNFDLVNVQWQGAFQLRQDPLEARYLIYIVLAGTLEHKIDDRYQTYFCSPNTATIIGPGQKLESIASSEGKALLISIDRDSIDSALSKLLMGGAAQKGHRPLKQPIRFHPSIDLTHELGLSLKKFVQFLWEAAAKNDPADFSSLVLKKLEQAFLDCLIEGLPSNYSEDLLYQTDGALACHVHKARAFIESHLHEDIKLGDIAAATSICSRLLQKAFSQHCGCSPMRFVAQKRLQQIRQELERSTSDTKIVDVMMHYGFTQGGKFAKEYQQLFGEKPSDTLKRSSQLNQQNSSLWQDLDEAQSDQVVGGVNSAPIYQLSSRFLGEISNLFNEQIYTLN
jgi:AraC-like DNA-binding protein